MSVMQSLVTLRSQKLWYWGGLQCDNIYINVVQIGQLTNTGDCIKKKAHNLHGYNRASIISITLLSN